MHRAAMVCRDCGEVSHIEVAALKPGALITCGACGLQLDPGHLRLPALGLIGLGAGAAPPRAPPRAPSRRAVRAR